MAACRPEVNRLSDVDLAVQLVGKETDINRRQAANAERVEQLAIEGRRFGSFLDEQFCWFLETFRFLKGRSRVISLADYNVEKRLVLAVPHRMLLGEPEELLPEVPQPAVRRRRPREATAMLDKKHKSLLRVLIYPVQFDENPTDGVDRVLKHVIHAKGANTPPGEYLAAIQAGLQSEERL